MKNPFKNVSKPGNRDRASYSPKRPSWYSKLINFRTSSWRRSMFQITNTMLPYYILFVGMMVLVNRGVPYIWILLIALPVSLLVVRIFIFCHDCCHGSFTPSTKANRVLGHLTGSLAFVAYEQWRRRHLIHHATSGQLDHRGTGDVPTLTFDEYRDANALVRFGYRLIRNPFVLLIFGPIYSFILQSRIPRRNSEHKTTGSVIITNLIILSYGVLFSLIGSSHKSVHDFGQREVTKAVI